MWIRDVERRRCDTRDLIACVTLICHSMPSTLANCHPESPTASVCEKERVRELLRCRLSVHRSFLIFVMLSEARRIGIKPKHPGNINGMNTASRLLTRVRNKPVCFAAKTRNTSGSLHPMACEVELQNVYILMLRALGRKMAKRIQPACSR
jgi:hypothetical protein